LQLVTTTAGVGDDAPGYSRRSFPICAVVTWRRWAEQRRTRRVVRV